MAGRHFLDLSDAGGDALAAEFEQVRRALAIGLRDVRGLEGLRQHDVGMRDVRREGEARSLRVDLGRPRLSEGGFGARAVPTPQVGAVVEL